MMNAQTRITGNILTHGDKSVALFDEQMEVLGLTAHAQEMRHRARVELNERLWRFAMENGGEPEKLCAHWVSRYDGSTWVALPRNRVFMGADQRFASEEACRRAIDEILIPFLKEHPECGY